MINNLTMECNFEIVNLSITIPNSIVNDDVIFFFLFQANILATAQSN